MDLARAVLAVRRALLAGEGTDEAKGPSSDRAGRAQSDMAVPSEAPEAASSPAPGKSSLVEAIVAALEELPLQELVLPPRPQPAAEMESSGLHKQTRPVKKPMFSDSFLPALIQVLSHLVDQLEERDGSNETTTTPAPTPNPTQTPPPETVEVIVVTTAEPEEAVSGSPAAAASPPEIIIEGPIQGIVDLLSQISMSNQGITIIAEGASTKQSAKGVQKGDMHMKNESMGVASVEDSEDTRKNVETGEKDTEVTTTGVVEGVEDMEDVTEGMEDVTDKKEVIRKDVVVETTGDADGGRTGIDTVEGFTKDEGNLTAAEAVEVGAEKKIEEPARRRDDVVKDAKSSEEEAVTVRDPVTDSVGDVSKDPENVTVKEPVTETIKDVVNDPEAVTMKEPVTEVVKDYMKGDDMQEDMVVVQSDVPVVSEETVPMMMMIDMVPSDALEMVTNQAAREDEEVDSVRSRREAAAPFPEEFTNFVTYPTPAKDDEEAGADSKRSEEEEEAVLDSLLQDKEAPFLKSIRGEAVAVGKKTPAGKPSPVLLKLVKLRFALSAEAKRQNFKNFQGFSEKVMSELVKTSVLSGADQLGVLLSLVEEHNEIKSMGTKRRASGVLQELRAEGSELYAALEDLSALKYS